MADQMTLDDFTAANSQWMAQRLAKMVMEQNALLAIVDTPRWQAMRLEQEAEDRAYLESGLE